FYLVRAIQKTVFCMDVQMYKNHLLPRLNEKGGSLFGNCPAYPVLLLSEDRRQTACVYVSPAGSYSAPSIINWISLSISSFSYAMPSSSGFSPFEKIFAMETYWYRLDFRFSLSPSPVTSSTFPLQESMTLKKPSISVIF